MNTTKTLLMGLMGLVVLMLVLAIWYLLLLVFSFVCTLWAYVGTVRDMKHGGFDAVRSMLVPLLTVVTGGGIGIGLVLGTTYSGVVPVTVLSMGSTVALLVYPILRHRRLVHHYQRHERYLIQP